MDKRFVQWQCPGISEALAGKGSEVLDIMCRINAQPGLLKPSIETINGVWDILNGKTSLKGDAAKIARLEEIRRDVLDNK